MQIPVWAESIRFTNCTVILNANNTTYRLPFDLSLSPSPQVSGLAPPSPRNVSCLFRIYPRGRELRIRGTIDMKSMTLSLSLLPATLETERFADLISRAPGVRMTGTAEVAGNLQARLHPFELTAGDFSCALSDPAIDSNEIKLISKQIHEKKEPITLSGRWTEGSLSFSFNLPELQLVSGNTSVSIPLITLTGKAVLNKDNETAPAWSTEFALKAKKAGIRTRTFSGGVDLMLSGNALYRSGSSYQATGSITAADGFFSSPETELYLNGIHGNIPLQWPYASDDQCGSLAIESMTLKKGELGTILTHICQTKTGAVYNGSHKSSLLPGTTLDFSGHADFSLKEGLSADLHFAMPQTRSPVTGLAELFPEARGVNIGGLFAIEGDISFAAGDTTSSLKVDVKDAKAEVTKNQTVIEGIDLSLLMTDLVQLESAPSTITYQKAGFGGARLSNGRIDFKIESPDTLLIEKNRFQWCGGTVSTHATRFSTDRSDYNIVLFCDRLNLAEILEQFGIENAEGDGTVNGRIPVFYENGQIRFEDAFLYSTPGVEGTIRIPGTDYLKAGLPPGSPQYSQLDFAGEALKDFKYSWVKLALLTEGENAVLKMRLNGKSTEPIPFRYERSLGYFKRLEAGSKGGIHQSILLDVNFRLPLNELLGYGKNIQTIFEKMK